MTDDIITFNEVFSIPSKISMSISQRLNHLINFGQRTALFYFFKDEKALLSVLEMVKIVYTNNGGRLWVLYDDSVEFSELISFFSKIHGVIFTPVSNTNVINIQNGDFVILLLNHLNPYILEKLPITSIGFLMVISNDFNSIDSFINELNKLEMFIYYNTFMVRDEGDIHIYELSIKNIQDIGYTIIPISRISESSSTILLLYDNYNTFIKSLLYLLNEIKNKKDEVVITSPNLPLIQKYLYSMKITKKYNIKFINYPIMLNMYNNVKDKIIVIEHPYPDVPTLKMYKTLKDNNKYVILSTNSVSVNMFIRTLLSRVKLNDSTKVSSLLNLFGSIIISHIDYTNMNSVVVECYTKQEFSLNRNIVTLFKLITRMKANAIIKTINHQMVKNFLMSIGWGDENSHKNKQKIVLIEPDPSPLLGSKQYIIITTDPKKYEHLNFEFIIDFDKLL